MGKRSKQEFRYAFRTGVGRARVDPQDRSWEGKSWPSGQELEGQGLGGVS